MILSSDCIFASSKYYKQAYARAQSICQPLGYNFLSKKQQAAVKKQSGPLVRKLLFDKPLIKPLSTKRTLLQKLPQFLSVSDSKRKNTYLSATPLSIISKTQAEVIEQLSTKFIPELSTEAKQCINLTNCFHSINEDALFAIGDYALSKYLVYYDGTNKKAIKHILGIIEEQFIEYDMHLITTQSVLGNDSDEQQGIKQKIQLLEFDHRNIKNKQKIDDHLNDITRKGQQLDLMYSGLHLFIGDCISGSSTYDILKQEIDNLKFLQYYVYLLSSGILGNGQAALLKVRGTIRHKTVDYLFLLKLIFTKVTVIKPAFSNFLDSQKYLICEGYVGQNGKQVHKYLSDNYDLLAEYGEQKLLVNPQHIFREQFLADNTKNFNDSLIVKGLKQTVDVFLKNSNLQIYPSRSQLIQKLNSYDDCLNFQKVIKEIEQHVPDEEQIKNQALKQTNGEGNNDNRDFKNNMGDSKPIVQQKQAEYDIFAFIKAKQQVQPAKKQPQKIKRTKIDEQQQMQKRLSKQFNEQQKIKQEKKKLRKQKQKKQKQLLKKDEDPYHYKSHFSYADG